MKKHKREKTVEITQCFELFNYMNGADQINVFFGGDKYGEEENGETEFFPLKSKQTT